MKHVLLHCGFIAWVHSVKVEIHLVIYCRCEGFQHCILSARIQIKTRFEQKGLFLYRWWGTFLINKCEVGEQRKVLSCLCILLCIWTQKHVGFVISFRVGFVISFREGFLVNCQSLPSWLHYFSGHLGVCLYVSKPVPFKIVLFENFVFSTSRGCTLCSEKFWTTSSSMFGPWWWILTLCVPFHCFLYCCFLHFVDEKEQRKRLRH